MPQHFVRVRVAIGLSVLMASILVCTAQVGASASGLRSSTSGNTASAPGITPTTIKIGILSDLSGTASSSFADTPGAMEARFEAINAAGGIDGRKITWVVDDTTSTPAGAETAAKDLVQNKGVFAIAELSSAFYGAAPYLAQAGIPVTGVALDGPEWYEQPNTNLFSTTGDATANGPAYGDGGFYKAIGATKISYVESNVSAAIQQGNSVYESIKRDGLQACDKTIVPIGSVNFTAFALSFKADGCNAAECACVLSSSLAMATALHQAGLNKVKIIFAAGPTPGHLPERPGRGGGRGCLLPRHRVLPDVHQCGQPGLLGRAQEIRLLLHGRHTGPRCGRRLAGRQPDGRGAATGREEPDPKVIHHQPEQGQRLDRQRPRHRAGQVRRLRQEPADPVLLVRAVRQG